MKKTYAQILIFVPKQTSLKCSQIHIHKYVSISTEHSWVCPITILTFNYHNHPSQ